ncbi:MAG: diacylglycerol kinase family protein [Bacteroidia bacterium]|nr:diacylglycerol kinase family protein [Bacteroidia bacterium]
MNQQKFTINTRIKSFVYAFKGIGWIFKNQHNLWIHLVLASVAIILGFILQLSPVEWAIIVIAIGFVLVAEIFNTAVESLINFVSPEYNKIAGMIKDISAAGVLLAALTALITGIIIFINKFVNI